MGLTLETRPDYVDEKEQKISVNLPHKSRSFGVQSVYDDVLLANKRGHSVETTIKATKLLKDAGFKINYHMMPGLPGSNKRRDFVMFKALFTNPAFQPRYAKNIPDCVVLKNSKLFEI